MRVVPPPLRLLAALLVVSVGCSTGLSPFAAPPEEEDDGAYSTPDTSPPRTSSGSAASAVPVAPPAASSPARPLAPTTAPPPPVMPSPPVARPADEPLFSSDLPLPSCAIRAPASDCPSAEGVLLTRGRDLPCRADQLGQRCAYPSEERTANLLECVAAADGRLGARWQFRRERCTRNCRTEMPGSFAPLAGIPCNERPLYPCAQAGTDQTGADDALKAIARGCAAPAGLVYGLLLTSDGCGGALFLEDLGPSAKCISDEVMRWRFECAPRCVSTMEQGDVLID